LARPPMCYLHSPVDVPIRAGGGSDGAGALQKGAGTHLGSFQAGGDGGLGQPQWGGGGTAATLEKGSKTSRGKRKFCPGMGSTSVHLPVPPGGTTPSDFTKKIKTSQARGTAFPTFTRDAPSVIPRKSLRNTERDWPPLKIGMRMWKPERTQKTRVRKPNGASWGLKNIRGPLSKKNERGGGQPWAANKLGFRGFKCLESSLRGS